MSADLFTDMQQYVQFGPEDAARLAALSVPMQPYLTRVVDEFYARLLAHDDARRILEAGPRRVELLRVHLREWLGTLFCGRYDAAYATRRVAIGQAHVRVGLAQQYMLTGMEIIWQALQRAVREVVLEPAASLDSLHKLLMLELGLILNSYRDSYSERIRELERAALQERLTRAEHLAEIGQLAATLAHEVKNPLAGISGAIQVIRDGLDPHDRNRPVLVEVLRQVDRLDATVKDLLAYARPTPPRWQSCDIMEVVKRVTGLLAKHEPFAKLHLQITMNGLSGRLQSDEHQLEQLLMNLLLNAAQASKFDGRVGVIVDGDEEMVRLRVEDDGHGMDDATVRRATEPFFTTRARGTGLGLSICRRIVDAHHGVLTILSRPGHGTTVEVRLLRRPPVGEVRRP